MRDERSIGILGGGQLAQMLAEAAHRLSYVPRPLCPTSKSPAVQSPSEAFIGSIASADDLLEVFLDCPIVTIENEFLDTMKLAQAVEFSGGSELFPSLTVIGKVQDKLLQKKEFEALALPTADFVVWASDQLSAPDWFPFVMDRFPNGAVLKWSKFGYDGKGNFVLKKGSDLIAAKAFCEVALGNSARVYAEEMIDFQSELAMVYTRSTNNEFVNYPLVWTRQEKGICKEVKGPAIKFGVSAKVETQAIEMGRALSSRLGMVGTFALEFFRAQDDQILINEMAPRVHNTGHFSQSECDVSQFENHIRAINGLPLKTPRTKKKYFAMWNLVGPFDLDGTVRVTKEDAQKVFDQRSVFSFWYDKTDLKSGRKMGHLNVSADTTADLEDRIREMRDTEVLLWRELGAQKK